MSKDKAVDKPSLSKEEKIEAAKGAVVLVFIIVFCLWLFSEPEPVVLTPEEMHKAKIEEAFNPWDGSHIKLVEHVKSLMNNPKSFDNLDTTYYDKGDGTLQIKMHWTGENAYGGTVRNYLVASADIETGEVIEILYTDP
tara:strand:- start:79 stop:495 length:417 start_codon:yes stop_codon:yes gene_type:complete